MTQEGTPYQVARLASCGSLMEGAGNSLLEGVGPIGLFQPRPQGSAWLTWTKASNRGPLSHLRRAKDLAQWATSLEVSLGVSGSRSAARRWNTWVCWKPSLPSGQRAGEGRQAVLGASQPPQPGLDEVWGRGVYDQIYP